ncbi:MAG: class I SAM-dependent methyltransferase [Chloroflexota bacterium]|nr:MAG: class I SAM-dependent methyltransferase [Chloroflexota bacterium]
MINDADIKRQVREFYNQVGWQEVGEGIYQNARYEDLRPVARDYIHRCHMRVLGYLKPQGRFLLDAGSGPIQYPEYLEYSRGYQYRVCADISIVALKEAGRRIGEHGLFVVADIAHLPFKPDAFDGVVSLHTIHHLPPGEHAAAYAELFRVQLPGSNAVVVNGWNSAPLMSLFNLPIRLVEKLYLVKRRLVNRETSGKAAAPARAQESGASQGTFVQKHDARWFKKVIAARFPAEIRVWRSAGVRFLRTFFHERWGGRGLLRLLFWLEDRFPRFFGENGQYPLIVIRKP